MKNQPLKDVARSLVDPGKGILAADESPSTIAKRLQSVGVEAAEATRCAYRQMLFSTPGLGGFISGVILQDETIRQKTPQGDLLRDLLARERIIAGIKVDGGTEPLARFPQETITRGLDGLRERLREYRELGAKFAKWRAVIKIGDGLPTLQCIRANAHLLARYAALCQEEGLVPIVEPEVLMDGSHTQAKCSEVTELTLHEVFNALADYRVVLEEMLLKPNMIVSGKDCPEQAGVEQVAEATLACLRRTVPAAVPGVVFLSGGQDEITATRHLNSMNQNDAEAWRLSFSYGRALQESALAKWHGVATNASAAQEILLRRARCNSAATRGEYSCEMERL
jgi:fructose-bisphosphate aldolase, class I